MNYLKLLQLIQKLVSKKFKRNQKLKNADIQLWEMNKMKVNLINTQI